MIRILPALSLLCALALPAVVPVADAARGNDAPAEKTTAPEDLEKVVMASVLIGDGHCDRALRVLDEIDLDGVGADFELARFWGLKGRCHFELGAQEDAATDFENAIAAGDTTTDTFLRLAQTQVALDRNEAAIATIDRAGAAALDVEGTYKLKSRALQALDRNVEAWDTLQAGRVRFPDDISFDREALYLLIKLGLYQEAREVGSRYLERVQDDPAAWLAVGESLRRTGNLDEAASVLEAARVRFPSEPDVYTRLAVTYVDKGLPGACGSILQQAAELDPTLAAPATECFRDAGRLERAFYMNSLIPDAELKARLRLDLLVRAEEWGQAIALVPRLETLGLLDEDPVAYAVGYAQFQAGRYDDAESTLKRIEDSQLFKDAATLRKAMADCRANPENCL